MVKVRLSGPFSANDTWAYAALHRCMHTMAVEMNLKSLIYIVINYVKVIVRKPGQDGQRMRC